MSLERKTSYIVTAFTLLTASILLTMPARAASPAPTPAGTPVTAPKPGTKYTPGGGTAAYTATPWAFSFSYNNGLTRGSFVGSDSGFSQTTIGN